MLLLLFVCVMFVVVFIITFDLKAIHVSIRRALVDASLILDMCMLVHIQLLFMQGIERRRGREEKTRGEETK